jgi:hypothetical protein
LSLFARFCDYCAPNLLMLAGILFLFATNVEAQSKVKVGVSTGYALSKSTFLEPRVDQIFQVYNGHDAYGKLQLRFPLSEGAEFTTGFGLRSRSLKASVSSLGEYFLQTDQLTMIDLPVGFGLAKIIRPRWSIRQLYGMELQVIGGSSGMIPNQPGGPSFLVVANPALHARILLFAEAALSYCTQGDFCLEWSFSYHQGMTGTDSEGQVVWRQPDLNTSREIYSDGSYFATGLGIVIPAAKLSGTH